MIYNIAVILTCFNRKKKTIACLESLFKAAKVYNNAQSKDNGLSLSIYLTDDNCTDGTQDAVRDLCKDKHIGKLNIIEGNGHCYWAGGMRLAWRKALEEKEKWHFFLLLNDDTVVFNNLFEELYSAHHYAIKHFGKGGLYSGITCDSKNPEIITYGGKNIGKSNIKNDIKTVGESDKPQVVKLTNANILMIEKNVVETISIFNEGFIHSAADYDYSLNAHKHGFPVLLTARVCGICDDDHLSEKDEIIMLSNKTLKERIAYVNAPTHCDADYFTYIKRNFPKKYIGCWILRKLRILSPACYYWINKKRGVKGYV